MVIDGQLSDWLPVAAGVPQGSILGPLLFLVYINDIAQVISSDTKIFSEEDIGKIPKAAGGGNF